MGSQEISETIMNLYGGRDDAVLCETSKGSVILTKIHDGSLVEHVKGHLKGHQRRGLYLVDKKQRVSVGTFDLEHHGDRALSPDVSLDDVVWKLKEYARTLGLKLQDEISKSGERHLHLFSKKKVRSRFMRRALSRMWDKVGFKTKAADGRPEIFPKQDEVAEGGFGSGIFLPYYGPDVPDGKTVFIDDRGLAIDIDFLDKVPTNSVEAIMKAAGDDTPAELTQATPVTPEEEVAVLPADAAPTMYGPGQREPFLFKRACALLRSVGSPKELAAVVGGFNQARCLPPHDEEKIQAIADSAWRYQAEKPEIRIGEGDPATMIQHAQELLIERNDPPKLYVYGRNVARISGGIEILSIHSFERHLIEEFCWVKLNGEDVKQYKYPPTPAARALYDMLKERLPLLEGVATYPFFNRAWVLVNAQGYDASSKCVLLPQEGLVVPPVSLSPTTRELELAVLLIDELFHDFPWARHETGSDRAHAFAFLLSSFIRTAIDGLTPGWAVTGPQVGAGKTLLVRSSCSVAHGQEPPILSFSGSEEEMRKRITAILAEGAAVGFFDNLPQGHKISSEALATVLTASLWKDRILGVSRNIEVKNMTLWVLSGNNLNLSQELARRIIEIRLNPRLECPWERDSKSFLHPLPTWALENRGPLVHACLTIIQAWVAAGRPQWHERSLGTYEDWASAMGGILANARIVGFLEDRRDFTDMADPMTLEWAEFVAAWAEEFGPREVRASNLLTLAQRRGCLSSILEGIRSRSDSALRAQLGLALTGQRDRVYGAYTIQARLDSHRKTRVYSLALVVSPAPPVDGTEASTPVEAPGEGGDGHEV